MRLARTIATLTFPVSFVALALSAGCSTGGSGSAAAEPQYEEGAVVHQTAQADLDQLKSKEPLSASRADLWVNGMGCPLCATNIDMQLKRVKGVSEAKVDLGAGKVSIELAGENKPSPARLADAVADAGFTLVKIESR